MDDGTLREILLVKAVEESDAPGRMLAPASRATATREALRDVGAAGAVHSPATAEAFLVARTRRLWPPLAERQPALAAIAGRTGWPWWLSATVLLAAFASGFTLSALGGGKRVDVLAMPFLGLVLWNLLVYLALLVEALRHRAHRSRGARGGHARDRGTPDRAHAADDDGWFGRHVAPRLGRLTVGLRESTSTATLPADALVRFTSDFGRAAAARLAADARRLMHLGAAAIALGLVAGIYLRGSVLQYLAGWESTFLGPAQVRHVIGVLFAPASALSGLPLPASGAEVEALHWSHGGVPAAPWLHLIALTLLLYVVVPRLLLAGAAGARALRLSRTAALPAWLVGYAQALAGEAAAGRGPIATPERTIDLTLISHTNVGKTTLARTLLHRDVGEVRDAEHVTTRATAYELIATDGGDLLQLWDTPGFADSPRLAARLEQGGAIGWFLTQVWDRFADRAFHLSQRAVASVREHADAVLYLVDARQGPEALPDLDAEMRILGWLDRPVIVLLNQLGEPQPADAERAEVERWASRLSRYPWVRRTLPFDAFARCWVQEDVLIGAIGAALPAACGAPWSRLATAWRRRNETTFEASVDALAAHLASAAADVEEVPTRGLATAARDWFGRLAGGAEAAGPFDAAAHTLARRTAEGLSAATQQLLALHGLAGRVSEEIDARVASRFSIATATDPGKAGLLGAAVTGALGGLAADLAAGGLTLGAGALVGALVGAAGATGLARAYNTMRGAERSTVRFSPELLTDLTAAAALRYLAVAHFGRGRGDYVASESPPHWDDAVRTAIARQRPAWDEAWDAAAQGESVARMRDRVRPLCATLLRDVLGALYPAASDSTAPGR